MEHIILGLLVVIEASVGWVMLVRISRDSSASRESLEAIMHGQEHIAELVAEVLRRTPER